MKVGEEKIDYGTGDSEMRQKKGVKCRKRNGVKEYRRYKEHVKREGGGIEKK